MSLGMGWAEASGLGGLPSPPENITTHISVLIKTNMHLLYMVGGIMPTCTPPNRTYLRRVYILILRTCEHVILLGKKHFKGMINKGFQDGKSQLDYPGISNVFTKVLIRKRKKKKRKSRTITICLARNRGGGCLGKRDLKMLCCCL